MASTLAHSKSRLDLCECFEFASASPSSAVDSCMSFYYRSQASPEAGNWGYPPICSIVDSFANLGLLPWPSSSFASGSVRQGLWERLSFTVFRREFPFRAVFRSFFTAGTCFNS